MGKHRRGKEFGFERFKRIFRCKGKLKWFNVLITGFLLGRAALSHLKHGCRDFRVPFNKSAIEIREAQEYHDVTGIFRFRLVFNNLNMILFH
jgi:hypothetical protein